MPQYEVRRPDYDWVTVHDLDPEDAAEQYARDALRTDPDIADEFPMEVKVRGYGTYVVELDWDPVIWARKQ